MAWPTRADGSNKKIGEMTPAERQAVTAAAARRLKAEADDPTSVFHRTCKAILTGPAPSRGIQ
jgi:hypothetical protein